MGKDVLKAEIKGGYCVAWIRGPCVGELTPLMEQGPMRLKFDVYRGDSARVSRRVSVY